MEFLLYLSWFYFVNGQALNHECNNWAFAQGVYGKPGTLEQPGSAGTALFLRLESCANTIMPLIEKTLQ